jgi:hypothetical protein
MLEMRSKKLIGTPNLLYFPVFFVDLPMNRFATIDSREIVTDADHPV